MEQQPGTPSRQTFEQKERFRYESQLQKKLAERAFPNEPVPLMVWAANRDGYSERFRAWLEDPLHEDVSLEDGAGIKALLETLSGNTLH